MSNEAKLLAGCFLLIAATPVLAQSAAETAPADAVVVTATRVERPSFDLPLSFDTDCSSTRRRHDPGKSAPLRRCRAKIR